MVKMNINLTEMNEDLSGPKIGGINKTIIQDNPENVILGYEGSHIYKINGKSPFYIDELNTLGDFVGLTPEQKADIFLS